MRFLMINGMADLAVQDAKVIIIGAGASGLAAASWLGKIGKLTDVLVLEKNDIAGRKLRATGNGKCNLANQNAVIGMPYSFDEINEVLDVLGIKTRTNPSGLVFPYNESASEVALHLISMATEAGIRIITSEPVLDIDYKDKFYISSQSGSFSAEYLVIACGGKAAPVYGTTGDGYAWLRKLGHQVTRVYPSLVPVECMEFKDGEMLHWYHALNGVRVKARVRLFKKSGFAPGECVFEESGEVQFRDYGLSGICIMNLSQHLNVDSIQEIRKNYEICLDLAPDFDISYMLDETQDIMSQMRTLLKPEIASLVLRLRSDAPRDAIINTIHNLRFTPCGLRGWREAQLSAGGLSHECYDENLCSRILPNLYITGEILDYQGPCGGYNLMHAFGSGVRAATNIIDRISDVQIHN